MRPELERLFLIEQQLLNTPEALPPAEWNLRRLLDADLEADAAAQQRLYQGLRRAGRRQLRRELAAIHAQLHHQRPRSWRAWGRHFLAWVRAWWVPASHLTS
ncbi:hypothetical protein Q3A66_10615 [Hymenobacter sp. BT770]|uniref:hypothetical protein n=1 Tax=Hymenobacter sp. BT770 TaxID=2886942 RepID=UPI001D121C42|nr:hypothetical protein [Hymenobacter sp. BT770]MCC3153396.1 hypothetical protein [Hymenobacter sp. BT770]MDO3415522.1 hypothetical protein [Hymenobacter sp. BT770]